MTATERTTAQLCFRFHIDKEHADAYRAAHAAVWPAMLEALDATGWHDYQLFLGSDGTVIGVVSVDDSLAAAQQRMAATEVNASWQAAMARFMPNGSNPDERFELLEEVFNLNAQRANARRGSPRRRSSHTGSP